jgi:hypothetical protein
MHAEALFIIIAFSSLAAAAAIIIIVLRRHARHETARDAGPTAQGRASGEEEAGPGSSS